MKYNKPQGVIFSHFPFYSCILQICGGEDAKSNTSVTTGAALTGEGPSQPKNPLPFTFSPSVDYFQPGNFQPLLYHDHQNRQSLSSYVLPAVIK